MSSGSPHVGTGRVERRRLCGLEARGYWRGDKGRWMRWAGLGGEVGGGLLLMGSKIRSTLFSSRALLGDFYWGRAGG